MITFVSEHAAEFKAEYGNLSPASLGAIQRNLLALADQGGEQFWRASFKYSGLYTNRRKWAWLYQYSCG